MDFYSPPTDPFRHQEGGRLRILFLPKCTLPEPPPPLSLPPHHTIHTCRTRSGQSRCLEYATDTRLAYIHGVEEPTENKIKLWMMIRSEGICLCMG